jgi:glycosyltransferase involved in cell wall biosynthesis
MVVVAQIGARMHYAVPAILARFGMLEQLYTDLYAPTLPKPIDELAARFGPASIRRWLGRIPSGVPSAKIVSFPALGFEYYRRQHSGIEGAITAANLWVGPQLCRRIIRRGLGDAKAVYTYKHDGLELLNHAREHGRFAITEQTSSPEGVFQEILLEEQADFHPWMKSRVNDLYQSALEGRERMEWKAAHLILCGSEFVRQGIRAMGGPAEKCRVLPYGVHLARVQPREHHHRPMRVLTVAAVRIMKGPHYLLEAARALQGKAEFRMAGQIDVTPYAQRLLREHVTLLGAVPRSEIHQQFAWADVFLLPTLCEGSATVCYEALSHGLPVITTPNAGSVVRDGVDGFIVPIRDSVAIVDRIKRFLDDNDLWTTMSANALARSAEYNLEKYGERLLAALQSVRTTVN